MQRHQMHKSNETMVILEDDTTVTKQTKRNLMVSTAIETAYCKEFLFLFR